VVVVDVSAVVVIVPARVLIDWVRDMIVIVAWIVGVMRIRWICRVTVVCGVRWVGRVRGICWVRGGVSWVVWVVLVTVQIARTNHERF